MGKQGPCCHCGVTSTPLWRNGPADKPVLCNACGSRWRTKGSLTNYTPLHARGPLEVDEIKIPKEKNITFKYKDQQLHKRKLNSTNVEVECGTLEYGQNFYRGFDEDTSNRSSSESAVSYSESCAHFCGADVNDVAGSSQTNVWESLVPSRKRTSGTRPKPSPVEKLTKDLYSILHQQSSYFSGSSEEDLLYENETPMGSIEIGNGSVLIRRPNLATLEEESEASSLPVENNLISSDYPHHLHIQNKDSTVTHNDNDKVRRFQPAEHLRRLSQEKYQILLKRDSCLGSIDLNDVVTCEKFMSFLSPEEQQQLRRYLPSVDTAEPPESLKNTFGSPQFQDALSSFQQMLRQGVFDLTFSALSADECKSLKRLILSNLSNATWVEQYNTLKDTKHKANYGGKKTAREPDLLSCSKSVSMKRPRDNQNQNSSEMKVTKGSKKVCKTGMSNVSQIKSPKWSSSDVIVKTVNGSNCCVESDGSCFSPKNLLGYGTAVNPLSSIQFVDDNQDQELLLDVRSNASFPEAELLSDFWKQKAVPNSFSAESGIFEKEESLSCYPSSSFSSKHYWS